MRFAILLGISLLTTACAEVWVITPNPRVEPPEVRGDSGMKIGGDFSSAHYYKATNDGSARPPDLTQPDVISALDTNGTFIYSPIQRLEFGGEVHPFSSGFSGILKWQILGEGTRTAEKGNIPLAVYLRLGTDHGSDSGDQKGIFGPGGYHWKGTIDGEYVHTGISSGFRVGEHMLLYGGVAYGQYWNKSEIVQDATTGDPGGSYKISDTGHAITAGAGIQANWHVFQFYVGAEAVHIQYHLAGSKDDTNLVGGFYFTPR